MLRPEEILKPRPPKIARDYSDKLLPNPDKCEHCRALRFDTNVLVLQRLSELSTISAVNLTLAIMCVMYLGSTVVCFIYTVHPVVKDSVFHRLEFGGTFIFTLVTTLALIFSPERRFRSKLLLKVLVAVNVCSSFMATLLVFLSLEEFEKVAHEIEYANELCTAVVDVLIVLTLDLKGEADSQLCGTRSLLAAFSMLAAAVPVMQLVVYNSTWGGEDRARYIEFIVRQPARSRNLQTRTALPPCMPPCQPKLIADSTRQFNSISAGISFWFCTDSMFIADRLKLEIMLAPTDLTVVIDAQSRRAVHDHGEHTSYLPPSVGGAPAAPSCGGCEDCADCRVQEATGLMVTRGLKPASPRRSPPQSGLSADECAPCELPESLANVK